MRNKTVLAAAADVREAATTACAMRRAFGASRSAWNVEGSLQPTVGLCRHGSTQSRGVRAPRPSFPSRRRTPFYGMLYGCQSPPVQVFFTAERNPGLAPPPFPWARRFGGQPHLKGLSRGLVIGNGQWYLCNHGQTWRGARIGGARGAPPVLLPEQNRSRPGKHFACGVWHWPEMTGSQSEHDGT